MYLLDTCALLRLVSAPERLSNSARAVVGDVSNQLQVSAISAFEVGLLANKGRIHLGSAPEIWFGKAVSSYGLSVISVSWENAVMSTQLPLIHNDPADRMIIATAIAHGIPIISSDHQFAAYPGVKVVW